jgi:hypothetical protein
MIFYRKPNFRGKTRHTVWTPFGIVAHFVPKYLQKNDALFKTNCIEDWESKIDAIVEETFNENMTVISGIPSWVQMYFERLEQKGGSPGDILKFQLVYYRGVNYEPYQPNLKTSLAERVDSIDCFQHLKDFLPTKIPKRERNVTTLEFRDFLRIYKE